MSSTKSTTLEPNLQKTMEEIEKKTEKKVEKLRFDNTTFQPEKDLGNTLIDIMKEGSAEFKEKTGRPMTYSEMRQMFG